MTKGVLNKVPHTFLTKQKKLSFSQANSEFIILKSFKTDEYGIKSLKLHPHLQYSFSRGFLKDIADFQYLSYFIPMDRFRSCYQ